jgi:hypothetical protein
MWGVRIFATLLSIGFLVPYFFLGGEGHMLPVRMKPYENALFVIWCVALVVIFWAEGIFDRR